MTSVCSGSFVLAAAGLLDGRTATTHWSCTEEFRQRFPAVRLEPDRIFVHEERVWTSAGTAGIDLALALIGEDLGEAVARRTLASGSGAQLWLQRSERMRRAFRRLFGASPSSLKRAQRVHAAPRTGGPGRAAEPAAS